MRSSLFVVVILFSSLAHAGGATQQAKIAQIVEAQGLQQMFQQQLDQAKTSASEMGKSVYQKIIAESGDTKGSPNPKLERIFTNYIERCALMFSAKELVDTWASFYGNGLSDKELDEILAYYKSPTGKKDVLASQAAMSSFSQLMAVEGQKRLNASIGQLMAEMKAALAN